MTRAERKEARRALAGWFRENGLTPTGAAWRAAEDDGTRDVDTLRRLNTGDGVAAKRLPDGAILPAGLHPGDTLADGSKVTCAPVLDPETGDVWVTTGTGTTTTTDTAYPAGVALAGVRRAPRTAPAWVQAAAEDYRSARDAWEAGRESNQPVPTTVPGAAGSGAVMYQLEEADYREHVPAPRYSDYLTEHAARNRHPDPQHA